MQVQAIQQVQIQQMQAQIQQMQVQATQQVQIQQMQVQIQQMHQGD
jgi:hypothetical protein